MIVHVQYLIVHRKYFRSSYHIFRGFSCDLKQSLSKLFKTVFAYCMVYLLSLIYFLNINKRSNTYVILSGIVVTVLESKSCRYPDICCSLYIQQVQTLLFKKVLESTFSAALAWSTFLSPSAFLL